MTEGEEQAVRSTLEESEEDALLQDSPLEIPRPKRAQGQWALGYLEPLTPQESNKRNQDGLDVYDRIIHQYAKNGWDSIDPADLSGRFRWYGLYTQRPEEDKMFMMRVRMPGGQLTAPQVDVCAEIARRWGGGGDRRHRPPELPVPQPPHRGRPRGLGAAGVGRPVDA